MSRPALFQRRFCSPAEAGQILDFSTSRIYGLIDEGVIPTHELHFKKGKKGKEVDSLGRRIGRKVNVDLVTVLCMAHGEDFVVESMKRDGMSEREIKTLLAGFRGEN